MVLGLALLMAQQPALISLETGYGTAAEALAKVSAASGVTLQAQGEVAKEELLIAVSDVSLEDLRVRIAQALDASWTESGGVWILVRTPQDAALERERALTARAADIEKAVGPEGGSYQPLSDAEVATLKSAFERLMQQRSGSFDQGAWQTIQENQPGTRLGRSLAGQMGARTLAAIPLDTRVVFSMRPTRRQEGFPRGVTEAFAAFGRDSKRILDAVQGENYYTYGLRQAVSGQEFAVEVSRTMNGLEMSLLTVRAQEEGEENVPGRIEESPMFSSTSWVNEPPAPPKELTEPMIMEFDESLRKNLGGMFARAMSESPEGRKAAQDWLIAIGGMPERVILPIAVKAMSAGGRDVVLNPSSFSWVAPFQVVAMSGMSGGSQPTELPEKMDLRPMFGFPKMWIGDWMIDENWLLGRPYSREDDEAMQSDPQALVRLMSKADSLTLRDVARFAAESGSRSMNNENFLKAMFVGGLAEMTSLYQPENWHVMRLLGTLSNAEWDALMRSGSVPFVNVTGAQRRILEQILYSDLIGSSWPVDEEGKFSRWNGSWEQAEPTFVYANGLPQNISLRAASGSNPILSIGYRTEEGREVSTEGELSTVAYWMVMREKGYTEGIPEVLWVQPQNRRFEVIGVVFDGKWTRSTSISSAAGPSAGTGSRMSLAQLPADMKAELEKLLKQYREMELEPPGQEGGGGVAPP